MEKVYEFVDEMEGKQGNCLPNHVTYSFLLKSLKGAEEVPDLLERMERNDYSLIGDTCNLLLKLYMDWDCQERVEHTWNEMERHGLGPDQRSYIVMIHGYCDKGRRDDALRYYREMKSKGSLHLSHLLLVPSSPFWFINVWLLFESVAGMLLYSNWLGFVLGILLRGHCFEASSSIE
ncbi:hypothetical protein F8388_005235 [Cannabis sativa]|uniref:Pentatricopeptide repeat-containing protein n=1 Tax=Cannabis sativa TaxID=3483 RepID=A0A7J6ELF1_CANSA|nr:hypothetical protein F8388_005235 [Cannabis sativa]